MRLIDLEDRVQGVHCEGQLRGWRTHGSPVHDMVPPGTIRIGAGRCLPLLILVLFVFAACGAADKMQVATLLTDPPVFLPFVTLAMGSPTLLYIMLQSICIILAGGASLLSTSHQGKLAKRRITALRQQDSHNS